MFACTSHAPLALFRERAPEGEDQLIGRIWRRLRAALQRPCPRHVGGHLMDRAQKLMIRLEVEALNAEFAFRVDHGPTATVADLFTEDGSYGRADGPRSCGREEIRATYAAREARGVRTARHLFTNLRLTHDGPDRASGTTIMTLFAEDGSPPLPAQVLAVSDFDDVYVRCDDGEWRYQSRTIRTLFTSGRPTVLPLGSNARAAQA